MVSEIKIPGLSIKYDGELPNRQLVLVGGGRQPSKNWLKDVAKDRTIWCIDHGVDICHELGLVPDFLLGDFDSCNADSLHWAEDKSAIIEEFEVHKDFTDTQAAIRYAREDEAFCILTGALGKRFDHTYSTIFSFGNSGAKGCIADERETICFLRDDESLTFTPQTAPKAISLLPITPMVSGVNTHGLHWELNDAELTQANPYAISNMTADDTTAHNTTAESPKSNAFTVSVKKGILAVYLCWKE